MSKILFTSESVTEGHPDKICDQISDAILDDILSKDKNARVACEVSTSTGLVLVAGEISTTAYVDIPSVVRKTILDIGYNNAEYGFDGNSCAVLTAINEQSPDIALGVNNSLEYKNGVLKEDDIDKIGAGDQGLMFGYATNETAELLPIAISYAHKLARKLSEVRKLGILKYLRPDGKTQVTVEYDEDDNPIRIDTIVISTQHDSDVSIEVIQQDLKKYVINEIIPQKLLDNDTKYFINPTGRFVIGGPQGDAGLTGRKIIVDTYGGYGRHGGGAFSGKDPTKVDRSGAYAARYIAKNIVASGIADKIEVQLAYAIGVARPVSIAVNTFGTGKLVNKEIVRLIIENFDLRPAAIIKELNLQRPIYKQTAAYGHFGRLDINLPWEQTDKADKLRSLANL